MARAGKPFINPKTGLQENDENKETSIIILDKNFTILGETLLQPTNKYFVRDWFIAKDGLFVSNSHYEYPKLNEDYMSFSKLALQEK